MAANVSSSQDLRFKRLLYIGIAVLVALVLVFGVVYYRERYATPAGVTEAPTVAQQLEDQVKSDPTNADARVLLAQEYLANKRYDDAIAQAQQIVQAYPKADGALLILGVAQNLKGDAAAAIEPLQKYIKKHKKGKAAVADSTLQAASYYLADSFLQLGRPADALTPLKDALTINPSDADSIYKYGMALAGVGKHEEALKRFEAATMLVPDYKEAYEGMAASYEALGNDNEAAYATAMVAFAEGDYKSARDQLQKVLEADKDHAAALIGLGLSLEQLGDLDAAKVALEKGLKLDARSVAASQALGRIEAQQQAEQ